MLRLRRWNFAVFDEEFFDTAAETGRTTKNIRAWPLGMQLGMGLGMQGL